MYEGYAREVKVFVSAKLDGWVNVSRHDTSPWSLS